MQGYSAFRETSGFSSMEQEVVFLAISQANGCEYCMAAHSFLAEAASGVPSDVTAAIRDGKQVPEMQLSALSVFARVMVIKRGLPSQSDVEAFLSAGYKEKDILKIIHAIAVKTIGNYTNHIFHTEVDNVFSTHAWTDTQSDIKSIIKITTQHAHIFTDNLSSSYTLQFYFFLDNTSLSGVDTHI